MKIALIMAYDEGPFIYNNLLNHYDLFDVIVVFEGTCSINSQPAHSSDNTIEEINRFIRGKDIKHKIKFISQDYRSYKKFGNREELEGFIKQQMLLTAKPWHGDIICLIDADEFHNPESLYNEIEIVKNNDKINHLILEEWQFCYSLSLYVNASHESRVWRFVNGAKYTNSNHIIYPDGTDISKDRSYIIPREQSNFFHLSYFKYPNLIKNKVLTFNRHSFTQWYNNCYLLWPQSPEKAYENNRIISQHMGWEAKDNAGFLEGQCNKIEEFNRPILSILSQYACVDHRQYIINNIENLRI